MKFFDKIIEGKWQEFCQDWVERRDQKKHYKEANYHVYFGRDGHADEHYQMTSHVVRVRAKTKEGDIFELHILTATRKDREGLYPIVCLIDNNGFEEIEEFDTNGNSKSGKYTLYYTALFFEPGDYVVTNSNAIGVYESSWYLFWGVDGDRKEYLSRFGHGQVKRMATKEEITLLNEVLWAHNKTWNKELLQLEDISWLKSENYIN